MRARARKINQHLPRGVKPARNKWYAAISLNGRTLYLGEYDTIEEAETAYDVAARDRDERKKAQRVILNQQRIATTIITQRARRLEKKAAKHKSQGIMTMLIRIIKAEGEFAEISERLDVSVTTVAFVKRAWQEIE